MIGVPDQQEIPGMRGNQQEIPGMRGNQLGIPDMRVNHIAEMIVENLGILGLGENHGLKERAVLNLIVTMTEAPSRIVEMIIENLSQRLAILDVKEVLNRQAVQSLRIRNSMHNPNLGPKKKVVLSLNLLAEHLKCFTKHQEPLSLGLKKDKPEANWFFYGNSMVYFKYVKKNRYYINLRGDNV
jgi:hypothetical protein